MSLCVCHLCTKFKLPRNENPCARCEGSGNPEANLDNFQLALPYSAAPQMVEVLDNLLVVFRTEVDRGRIRNLDAKYVVDDATELLSIVVRSVSESE